MRFTGFIGPSYTLKSVNADCQQCVNMYPEPNPASGREDEVAFLAPTPGLTEFCELPTMPVRGLWRSSNDILYAVGGNKFYSIQDDGTTFEIGTLNTGVGPVSMADNGLQLIIVDGPNGYFYQFDIATFNLITDPDFQGADQVSFQDGYFLFNKPDSEQWYISGLRDITFDGLDISTAEASPDKLRLVISANQTVYAFGTQSIEGYYNSGDADFPFTRIQGSVIDVGCSAGFSVQKMPGGSLVWLGGDSTGVGIVYAMAGYQAQKVSTPAVEAVIRTRSVAEITQSRAWTYQQGGHVFYALNIPGLTTTLVYDLSTRVWHDRAYLNPTVLNPAGSERHRADCHIAAYGMNLVGDWETGKIYSLDQDNFTDDGRSIARVRTSPHISKGLHNFFHTSFQLDMETGVGLDGLGQGVNPKAMLQWSNDGGHTWSNEHWADIGRIGQTKARVLWRRLGTARDRVYRVRITDPVKVFLLGAELGLEEGTS